MKCCALSSDGRRPAGSRQKRSRGVRFSLSAAAVARLLRRSDFTTPIRTPPPHVLILRCTLSDSIRRGQLLASAAGGLDCAAVAVSGGLAVSGVAALTGGKLQRRRSRAGTCDGPARRHAPFVPAGREPAAAHESGVLPGRGGIVVATEALTAVAAWRRRCGRGSTVRSRRFPVSELWRAPGSQSRAGRSQDHQIRGSRGS